MDSKGGDLYMDPMYMEDRKVSSNISAQSLEQTERNEDGCVGKVCGCYIIAEGCSERVVESGRGVVQISSTAAAATNFPDVFFHCARGQ